MGDVRDLVLEFQEKKRKADSAQKQFDAYKESFYEKVRGFMERQGKTSFSFRNGDGFVRVSDVRPARVVFDADAVCRNLPKDVTELFVKETLLVEDSKGFWRYMDRIGADRRMVESFMSIKREVDKDTVDWLIENGDVTLEQLEGTYDVGFSRGYVKVVEET